MTGIRVFILAFAFSASTIGFAQQNTDALASLVLDIGRCERTLGAMRDLQAAAIKGDVLDLATFKAKIEKANPTLEFDAKSFTLKEKPKAEKKPEPKAEKPPKSFEAR